jgi:hypothetical protein
MATDNPPNETFVGKVVQAFTGSVALTARIDQRQVSRRVAFAPAGVKEQLLQRDGDFLRKPDAHKATSCHGVARANQPDGLLRANDFASRDTTCRRGEGMLKACGHDVSKRTMESWLRR